MQFIQTNQNKIKETTREEEDNMCFKKTKVGKKTNENREAIALNARRMDVLISLNDDPELESVLLALKNKIKYLTPSASSKVSAYDGKIKNAIDDLKIAFNRSNSDAIREQLKNLDVMISERNTFI